jgi:hypothetical protein
MACGSLLAHVAGLKTPCRSSAPGWHYSVIWTRHKGAYNSVETVGGRSLNGQRINVGTFVSAIVESPPPAIAKPVFEVGTDGPVHVDAAIEPAAPA